MNDKYDEAIDKLTAGHDKNPEGICESWASGEALFQFVSPDGGGRMKNCIGCLTEIRACGVGLGDRRAWTDKLTEEIRADERIPMTPEEITLKHLPIFAGWQRWIDKELGR